MQQDKIAIFCAFTRPNMARLFLKALATARHEPASTALRFIVDIDCPQLVADLKEYARRYGYNDCQIKSNPDNQVRHHDPNHRRRRIAEVKQQSKDMLAGSGARYVISLEDDTVMSQDTLWFLYEQMTKLEADGQKPGLVEAVQIGRWGIPIVGAWEVNQNRASTITIPADPKKRMSHITGGGFYCYITPLELYIAHDYKWHETPYGPDVEYGLQLTGRGYANFIDWRNNVGHRKETGEILWPQTTKVEAVMFVKKGDRWHRRV